MTPKTKDSVTPLNQNDKIRKENEEFEEFDLTPDEGDDNPAGLLEEEEDEGESDDGCGCS